MPTWRRTAVGFGHDIAAADRGSPLADGRGLSSLEAPGLGAGSQREARESPLADPILEAPDAVAVAAEQSDPAGCHHAVGPTAVGDDVGPRRQEAKLLLEAVKRDRNRPWDVARLILLPRPQVEKDDVRGPGPADEFVAADRLELAGRTEEGPDDAVDLGQAVVCHGEDRGEEFEHVLASEAGGRRSRRR